MNVHGDRLQALSELPAMSSVFYLYRMRNPSCGEYLTLSFRISLSSLPPGTLEVTFDVVLTATDTPRKILSRSQSDTSS